MGVLKKDAKSKEMKRERKKRSVRKYGQATLKHSRMGIRSLIYGAASLALLAACIMTAYVMRGDTYSFVGGLGIMSIMGAGLGIWAGIKGQKEREKKYITCRVGLTLNGLLLFGAILIFLGGLM